MATVEGILREGLMGRDDIIRALGSTGEELAHEQLDQSVNDMSDSELRRLLIVDGVMTGRISIWELADYLIQHFKGYKMEE